MLNKRFFRMLRVMGKRRRQQAMSYIAKGIFRIFGTNQDNFPHTGFQPFGGDITHPS